MIIGFAGKGRSGKTTAAMNLVNKYGFTKLSFAKPLKESLVAMTGLPMEYFTDTDLKNIIIPWIGKTPIQLMQIVGTDCVRDMIGYNFWTERMKMHISTLPKPVPDIVIDDIRFENEITTVHGFDGLVIKLTRDNELESDHPSNNDPLNFADISIDNNKSKGDLFQIIDTIYKYEEHWDVYKSNRIVEF